MMASVRSEVVPIVPNRQVPYCSRRRAVLTTPDRPHMNMNRGIPSERHVSNAHTSPGPLRAGSILETVPPPGAEGERETGPSHPPWPLIVAFWAAAWALFAGLRLALVYWINPESARRLQLIALADYAIQYGMWALLTPPIFWLSWRFPVTRRNWFRRVPLHLAIGAAVVLATMLSMLFLHNQYAHPRGTGHSWTLVEVSRQLILYGYNYHLLFYLGILTAGFAFHFYRNLQRQRVAAARVQSQLTEARLQALRMQLHPHFLFNTLNTISSLTEDDPRAARRVIARLGELLRRALESTDEQEVTLAEELRFAELYLQIAGVRFGDRMRVEIDIEPGLEEAVVPNLILQPLVENAVEHGIAESFGAGVIRIEAERYGDDLHCRVSNSGPAIRNGIIEGVGLSNTRARLEQLYGSGGRLVLSETNAAATVEVVIPYHTAPIERSGRAGTPAPGASR